MKKFWRMETRERRNKAGGTELAGELFLYGEFTEYRWCDNDISSASFLKDLKALGDVKSLDVHINSLGGSVFTGSAIYSLLKQHGASITVYIDGIAASMASVIAMAGDMIVMPENAMMMIHNPWNIVMGDADDLRKEAETLDKIRETLLSAYEAKTGMEREELVRLMDAETWLTAAEAVEMGFADVTTPPMMAAACVKDGVWAINGQLLDLTRFKNTPESLKKEGGICMDMKINSPAAVVEAPAVIVNAADGQLDYEAGRQAGITEERERQRALDELMVSGMEDVVIRAKYETGEQPETVAVAILRAQKAAGAAALSSRMADAAESGVNNIASAVTGDGVGLGAARLAVSDNLKNEIKKRRGL